MNLYIYIFYYLYDDMVSPDVLVHIHTSVYIHTCVIIDTYFAWFISYISIWYSIYVYILHIHTHTFLHAGFPGAAVSRRDRGLSGRAANAPAANAGSEQMWSDWPQKVWKDCWSSSCKCVCLLSFYLMSIHIRTHVHAFSPSRTLYLVRNQPAKGWGGSVQGVQRAWVDGSTDSPRCFGQGRQDGLAAGVDDADEGARATVKRWRLRESTCMYAFPCVPTWGCVPARASITRCILHG